MPDMATAYNTVMNNMDKVATDLTMCNGDYPHAEYPRSPLAPQGPSHQKLQLPLSIHNDSLLSVNGHHSPHRSPHRSPTYLHGSLSPYARSPVPSPLHESLAMLPRSPLNNGVDVLDLSPRSPLIKSPILSPSVRSPRSPVPSPLSRSPLPSPSSMARSPLPSPHSRSPLPSPLMRSPMPSPRSPHCLYPRMSPSLYPQSPDVSPIPVVVSPSQFSPCSSAFSLSPSAFGHSPSAFSPSPSSGIRSPSSVYSHHLSPRPEEASYPLSPRTDESSESGSTSPSCLQSPQPSQPRSQYQGKPHATPATKPQAVRAVFKLTINVGQPPSKRTPPTATVNNQKSDSVEPQSTSSNAECGSPKSTTSRVTPGTKRPSSPCESPEVKRPCSEDKSLGDEGNSTKVTMPGDQRVPDSGSTDSAPHSEPHSSSGSTDSAPHSEPQSGESTSQKDDGHQKVDDSAPDAKKHKTFHYKYDFIHPNMADFGAWIYNIENCVVNI